MYISLFFFFPRGKSAQLSVAFQSFCDLKKTSPCSSVSDSVTALHFRIFLFWSQTVPTFHFQCLSLSWRWGRGLVCVYLVKILWCVLSLPVPGWPVYPPTQLPSVMEGRGVSAQHRVSSGVIHFLFLFFLFFGGGGAERES